MTQADFQRDVKALEDLKRHMWDTMDSADDSIFEAVDRAIENARVLAALSEETRGPLLAFLEHEATVHSLMAECGNEESRHVCFGLVALKSILMGGAR